jgi:hypothetical protein
MVNVAAPNSAEDLQEYMTVTLPDGQEWPALNSEVMFVRPHFPLLYEDVMSELRRESGKWWLLTGTPGIAKSTFGLYCLWRVIMEGKRTVVYQYDKHSKKYVVYPDGQQYTLPKLAVSNEETDVLDDPDAVFITDSITPSPNRAVTLMVSSPDREKYKEFQKFPQTLSLTAPTWSWGELRAWRERCFPRVSVDLMEWRYSLWGGNVRHVLAKNDKTSRRELAEVLGRVKTAQDVLTAKADMGVSTKTSTDRLFHLIPAGQARGGVSPSSWDYYDQPTAAVCSEVMRAIIVGHVPDVVRYDLWLALGSGTAGAMNSALGAMVERWFTDVLCRGGEFRVQRLTGGLEGATMSLPPLRLCKVPSLKSVPQASEPTLFLSSNPREAVVDAMLSVGGLLLQFTMNLNHTIKEVHLPELLQSTEALADPAASPLSSLMPAGSSRALVFVVPQDMVAKCTKEFRFQAPTKDHQDSMHADAIVAAKASVAQFALGVPITVPDSAALAAEVYSRCPGLE